MTNELEKQFFDTFGIEPKWKSEQCDGWMRTTAVAYFTNLEEAKKFGIVFQEEPEYPQITDRILLELICIDFNENPYKCRGGQASVAEVKERILSDFIHEFENDLYLDKEDIKHQVRTIFKEER